jgi:hypothetical protein
MTVGEIIAIALFEALLSLRVLPAIDNRLSKRLIINITSMPRSRFAAKVGVHKWCTK